MKHLTFLYYSNEYVGIKLQSNKHYIETNVLTFEWDKTQMKKENTKISAGKL